MNFCFFIQLYKILFKHYIKQLINNINIKLINNYLKQIKIIQLIIENNQFNNDNNEKNEVILLNSPWNKQTILNIINPSPDNDQKTNLNQALNFINFHDLCC